jgi:hypothetical protein
MTEFEKAIVGLLDADKSVSVTVRVEVEDKEPRACRVKFTPDMTATPYVDQYVKSHLQRMLLSIARDMEGVKEPDEAKA